jgi:hypothetical protein
MRKTTKILCQDIRSSGQDSNLVPPKCEAGGLPTTPQESSCTGTQNEEKVSVRLPQVRSSLSASFRFNRPQSNLHYSFTVNNIENLRPDLRKI